MDNGALKGTTVLEFMSQTFWWRHVYREIFGALDSPKYFPWGRSPSLEDDTIRPRLDMVMSIVQLSRPGLIIPGHLKSNMCWAMPNGRSGISLISILSQILNFMNCSNLSLSSRSHPILPDKRGGKLLTCNAGLLSQWWEICSLASSKRWSADPAYFSKQQSLRCVFWNCLHHSF